METYLKEAFWKKKRGNKNEENMESVFNDCNI